MKDSYGRTVDYMRISITDRCNLRCRYCMPEMPCFLPRKELLSLEEILDICVPQGPDGYPKIKITGGEPSASRLCGTYPKLKENSRNGKGDPDNQRCTLPPAEASSGWD